MKFIDVAKILVQAGDGGRGCVSFRREKYVPNGGPNGGDGGDGGSVVLETSRRVTTLLDFKYKHVYKAKRGTHGMGSDKTGRRGEHCVIKVPVGTMVYDAATGDQICDLSEENQSFIVANGGQGGKGNARFVTPTRQAPDFAQPGTEGEHRNLVLELKLVADVGIIGFPNAGKSTFISAVSRSQPKVADYPFTTLTPNLGVVSLDTERVFVLADMPGLIEGAHQGTGLGIEFLRHIERTRVLLHIVSPSIHDEEHNPLAELIKIEEELHHYFPRLLERPRVVALNKTDLPWTDNFREEIEAHCRENNLPFFTMSAATRENLRPVLEELWRQLETAPEPVLKIEDPMKASESAAKEKESSGVWDDDDDVEVIYTKEGSDE